MGNKVFTKGFLHDEDLNVSEHDLKDLTEAVAQGYRPTGLKTPNRKMVSPEIGRRQIGFSNTPKPPEFESERIADDYIKCLEYALKRDDLLPEGYLSEFLQADAQVGAAKIKMTDLKLETSADAGLTKEDLLDIQNGLVPKTKVKSYKAKKISTYADLGSFVHDDKDVQYQVAYHNLKKTAPLHRDSNKHDSDKDWGNFVWWNAPYHCRLIAQVLHSSLIFAWQSKYKFMFPRPEYYGYLLENKEEELPFAKKIKESEIGKKYFDKYGTWQLSQMYPEGSPTHPSYPQGHQSVAFGVGLVLRYIFDTDADFKAADGTEKNVGEEISKLSYNVAYARTIAGVHFLCDTDDCIEAAEENAVKIIKQINKEYPFDVNTRNVIGATGKRYSI